jgi:hypothetical protein
MISCDKEAIKTALVLHGQRKAARIAGLSENTVKSWALRYHWNKLPKASPDPAHPIRTHSPAAIVADDISQNKERSRVALSRYTAEAAEEAANLPKGQKLNRSGKAKDLANVHSILWPQEQQKPIFNLGILIGEGEVRDAPDKS